MTTLTGKAVGKTGKWADERFGGAGFLKRSLNKVFPDHWSFMLGEIALYSFVILLLTGTFLTLWFDPSVAQTTYQGSYDPLRGTEMTEAYRSTIEISFDVRGGLLMRQIHHWAALLFVSAICVHAFRVFFTGAFRKPREVNWVIGALLLQLALLEGFAGYSLPDDLLSGTGLRIAYSVLESVPVIGTYAAFFLFGGNFPGDAFIPRLYTIHVLLVPGLMLALIGAHLMILWHQKHTQFPGPGRTEHNVVGHRFFPVFFTKTNGFFLLVFAVLAGLSTAAQVNPVWLYGPYNPAQVSAGSQPDWYIGFLEGSLRLMPAWETNIVGHTISWNIFIPGVILPGLMLGLFTVYPWIEAWATGDRRHHNLLDRPRDRPVRTALGVMAITFYVVLWMAGGNDVIAKTFHLSINSLTWFFRIALIALPPIAFVITKRICIGLQRRDRDLLEHGNETGIIKRLPTGEYVEVHSPATERQVAILTGRGDGQGPPPAELTDGNGRLGRRSGALISGRRKVGKFFTDAEVPPPPEPGHGEHQELTH